MTATYSITPIIVATGPHREASRFTYLNNFGDKISIPYVAWLIRGRDLNVLADTACSADAFKRHIKPANGELMIGGEQFADVVDVTPLVTTDASESYAKVLTDQDAKIIELRKALLANEVLKELMATKKLDTAQPVAVEFSPDGNKVRVYYKP